MKLKEVCEATGLSRKTIRLYEEKGLLAPRKERRNGRDFREYTEADVQQLRVIAALRRAWFTMEEIRRMQEDPEAIREIIPQYQAWLFQQKTQLDGLIAAAKQLQPDEIENVSQLSSQIGQESQKLPLPPADIHPHFRHLDQLEQEERLMSKPKVEGQRMSDTRAYRQTALVMDRDRSNDQAITLGQIIDLQNADWHEGGHVVREEKEPLWLRVMSVLGGWTLAIGIVLFAIMEIVSIISWGRDEGVSFLAPGILLVLGGGVYAATRAYIAYRDRQRWLRIVREQEAEKQQKRQTNEK